jgi:hypothetical protein
MLLSAVAALVLFAAPETTQSGEPAAQPPAAPAAEAKPATKRVCQTIEVAGSNLPKKKCRDVPIKAEPKPTEEAKADQPKVD